MTRKDAGDDVGDRVVNAIVWVFLVVVGLAMIRGAFLGRVGDCRGMNPRSASMGGCR